MSKLRMKHPGRELIELLGAIADSGPPVEYAVVEKSNEKRITVGVVYAPDLVDAHGEYAGADDLEEMVHGYMENGDLRLRKQHRRSEVIGDVVGIMVWPFEQEVELKPVGVSKATKSTKLPAGTVYAAVRWTPDAWQEVKAGRITGFSMGGAAVRVQEV